jgi:hypothetical protein
MKIAFCVLWCALVGCSGSSDSEDMAVPDSAVADLAGDLATGISCSAQGTGSECAPLSGNCHFCEVSTTGASGICRKPCGSLNDCSAGQNCSLGVPFVGGSVNDGGACQGFVGFCH